MAVLRFFVFLANDESRHPAVNRVPPPLPALLFISRLCCNGDSEEHQCSQWTLFRLKKARYSALKRVDLLHIRFHFAQNPAPAVPVYR